MHTAPVSIKPLSIMKSAVLLSMIPSVLGTTIYLAGDSTMAKGGTGSGTAGMVLPTSLNTSHESTSNNIQDGASMSLPTHQPRSPIKPSPAAVQDPIHAKADLPQSPAKFKPEIG